MKVMILRYWNGKSYRFTLRRENKKFFDYRWFNTMKQAREYAALKGVEIIERPDLIKKWSTPSKNRVIA